MQEYTIKPITIDNYADCARFHHELLKEGVLHLLGLDFLMGLYKNLLKDKHVYGWIALVNGVVGGVILVNSKRESFILREVLKSPILFGTSISKAILKHRGIMLKLLQYLKYGNRIKGMEGGHDILLLAVPDKYSGKGIGSKLLQAVCNSTGTGLSVSTTITNERAIHLYRKFGFEKNCFYRQSGMDWVTLIRKYNLKPLANDG